MRSIYHKICGLLYELVIQFSSLKILPSFAVKVHHINITVTVFFEVTLLIIIHMLNSYCRVNSLT